MTDFFNQKVTIYNDIPADEFDYFTKSKPEESESVQGLQEERANVRRFDRFVIEKCSIQGGYVEKADGTIQNIDNAQTVITKDVQHYKSPIEYMQLPVDEKDKYFTVQIDDFVVFGEVDDVVTTSREFQELQQKYGNNGMLITSVNPYIFGTAVDNVTMTNV